MTEYVLVPREPTPEMLKAAAGITQKARMYRAMLAAAPQQTDDVTRDPRVLLAACLLHPLPLSLANAIKEVLAAAPQQQQAEPSRTDLGTRVVDVLEAIHGESQQQAEPALIGSDLFPSTIRLANGRDVQLGELVRRAAHGLEAAQWNLLPQKARDSAMVKALDDWQRGLTTQQQAEPVAWLYFYGKPQFTTDKSEAELMAQEGRPVTPLYAYPVLHITTTQVEQIKRLADAVEDALRSVVEAEYAAMGDPSLKYKRNELDEARVALHAALDALVAKGE